MPVAPGKRLNTAFLVRLMFVLPDICPRIMEMKPTKALFMSIIQENFVRLKVYFPIAVFFPFPFIFLSHFIPPTLEL